MPECHSTNDIAAELARGHSIIEGMVIVTDHQTRGRGQRGNHWHSAKGQNITFSIILKPTFLSAKDHFELHYVTSLAVYTALKEVVRDVKIKWPNDILVKRKKICGILIENTISKGVIDTSIVGVGLNVNEINLVNEQSTSLRDLTGLVHDRESLLATICEHLEAAYLTARARNSSSLKAQYLKVLFQYQQQALYSAFGETFSGSIVGIDGHGRLMIECAEEVRYYDFKEVQFIY